MSTGRLGARPTEEAARRSWLARFPTKWWSGLVAATIGSRDASLTFTAPILQPFLASLIPYTGTHAHRGPSAWQTNVADRLSPDDELLGDGKSAGVDHSSSGKDAEVGHCQALIQVKDRDDSADCERE